MKVRVWKGMGFVANTAITMHAQPQPVAKFPDWARGKNVRVTIQEIKPKGEKS